MSELSQAALVELSKWIDASNVDRDPEAVTWGRLAKIMEESGEVIRAFIGLTGQNPRKGVTHDLGDVNAELLDVAVTALGAYEHLNNNAGSALRALDRHIIGVASRAIELKEERRRMNIPRDHSHDAVPQLPRLESRQQRPRNITSESEKAPKPTRSSGHTATERARAKTLKGMTFAATARCTCGAGLAYGFDVGRFFPVTSLPTTNTISAATPNSSDSQPDSNSGAKSDSGTPKSTTPAQQSHDSKPKGKNHEHKL